MFLTTCNIRFDKSLASFQIYFHLTPLISPLLSIYPTLPFQSFSEIAQVSIPLQNPFCSHTKYSATTHCTLANSWTPGERPSGTTTTSNAFICSAHATHSFRHRIHFHSRLVNIFVVIDRIYYFISVGCSGGIEIFSQWMEIGERDGWTIGPGCS